MRYIIYIYIYNIYIVICLLRECTGITVYSIHLPLFFSTLDNTKNTTNFIVFSVSFAVIKVSSSIFCILSVDSISLYIL